MQSSSPHVGLETALVVGVVLAAIPVVILVWVLVSMWLEARRVERERRRRALLNRLFADGNREAEEWARLAEHSGRPMA